MLSGPSWWPSLVRGCERKGNRRLVGGLGEGQ